MGSVHPKAERRAAREERRRHASAATLIRSPSDKDPNTDTHPKADNAPKSGQRKHAKRDKQSHKRPEIVSNHAKRDEQSHKRQEIVSSLRGAIGPLPSHAHTRPSQAKWRRIGTIAIYDTPPLKSSVPRVKQRSRTLGAGALPPTSPGGLQDHDLKISVQRHI